MMGASIAMACANAATRSLSDGSTERRSRAASHHPAQRQSSVDWGLTVAAAAERFARIRLSGATRAARRPTSHQAVRNMTIKKEVFGEISVGRGQRHPSNTDTRHRPARRGPECRVGHRPAFSARPVMRLVEIVRGVATGKVAVAAALQFVALKVGGRACAAGASS
jgi:3-hydroxyacyl-CoA dehydrogenase